MFFPLSVKTRPTLVNQGNQLSGWPSGLRRQTQGSTPSWAVRDFWSPDGGVGSNPTSDTLFNPTMGSSCLVNCPEAHLSFPLFVRKTAFFFSPSSPSSPSAASRRWAGWYSFHMRAEQESRHTAHSELVQLFCFTPLSLPLSVCLKLFAGVPRRVKKKKKNVLECTLPPSSPPPPAPLLPSPCVRN